MKCFVINLERAVDRRNKIIDEFKRHSVQFEFFTAKDKLQLNDCDLREVGAFEAKYLNWKYPDFNGHLACWLSHVALWKRAVKNGDNMIAVFEDDAKLSSDINAALDAIEAANSCFDIVFLNNRHPSRHFRELVKLSDRFTLGLIRFATIGAEGYVISKHAMQHLLLTHPNYHIQIDKFLEAYWIHGLTTYYIKPTVVFHGDPTKTHLAYIGSESDAQSIAIPKRTFLQRIRYLFRMSIAKRIGYYRRLLTKL